MRDSIRVVLLSRANQVIVAFERRGFYAHFIPGLLPEIERIFIDVVRSSTQAALDRAITEILG